MEEFIITISTLFTGELFYLAYADDLVMIVKSVQLEKITCILKETALKFELILIYVKKSAIMKIGNHKIKIKIKNNSHIKLIISHL